MRSRSIVRTWLAGVLLSLATMANGAIVIHEIHYNSPGSPDVEWIEIYNPGPSAQSLTGWSLLDDNDGNPPCPLSGTIAPGAFLIVAGDTAQFTSAYPGAGPVNPAAFGPGFALGNTLDAVRLFAPGGLLVDSVYYSDSAPWPIAADGGGPSLELINALLDNSLASSWAAGVSGGTPGAQNSVHVADTPPAIVEVARNIALPGPNDTVLVSAQVTDDHALVAVELQIDEGAGYVSRPMRDDGLSGDGAPGDGRFGSVIEPRTDGTILRYRVQAEDDLGQTTLAPAGPQPPYYAYTVGHRPPPLRINEIVASNQFGLTDEFGDADDWIEIRNPGPDPAVLTGLFVTNDLTDPLRHSFTALTLPAGGRILVWADEEPGEGPLHAPFKLARESGEVGLYDSIDHGNTRIDSLTYGPQETDRSFGHSPEDSLTPEYLLFATPYTTNDVSGYRSDICINEFLAASSVGAQDWIELHNRGTATVDISGWHLSDEVTTTTLYTFPSSTLIPPGGKLSVDQATLGFGIDENGSEILLLTAPGGLVGRDYLDYGPQENDISHGRFADGTPNWHRFSPSSRDLPNACSSSIPPFAAVTGLRFDAPQALGWATVGGATHYDVALGDLDALSASGGDFAGSVFDCAENDSADTRSWAPAVPAPGHGFFYLVRAVDSRCRFGTWNTGQAGQVGSRDIEIGSAPGRCP